jgi:hypothetical protein
LQETVTKLLDSTSEVYKIQSHNITEKLGKHRGASRALRTFLSLTMQTQTQDQGLQFNHRKPREVLERDSKGTVPF